MLIDPMTGSPSLAFTLFAAECEGDLPTEVGKRNKLIKTLRQRSIYENINETIIRKEAAAAGLTFLSDAEVRLIKEEI
jgi:hypothetical protein